jgi:hypothetical protein
MEFLKSIFYFHEESGTFFWKKSLKPVERRHKAGYWVIRHKKKDYLAHRVAWFFYTGQLPVNQLDHINGNRQDKRFINLRECTNQQNQFNRKLNKNSTSGYKGVYLDKRRGTWQAELKFGQKKIYLGAFPTSEQAAAAYDWKAVELFGEFAKTNGDVCLI